MSRKYNSKEREEWMQSFQSNYKNQTWHNNQVYHPNQIKHFSFFKFNNTYKVKIDPTKIHGLKYAYSYNCTAHNNNKVIDWKHMLHWLRRLDWVIDNFKTKEELINHIHKNNEPKSVKKYGNHYFTTGGQHRLCLAKYLEIEEVEVDVQEYKLNKELFIREKTIEKYYAKLLKYHFVDQTSYSNIKYDFISIKLNNSNIFLDKKFVPYLINRFEILQKRKYKSIPNILKKIYKMDVINNYHNSLKTKKRLYLLDFYLIKHIKFLYK